jgi:Domain of unknown function (DUF4190)/GYF domain 2
MQNIYVVRGTEQAGPFTESEIRAQLASGALTPGSMVWWDGLPEWTPLSRTPLATLAAVPQAPFAPPVASALPAAMESATKKTSGLAITSLTTGIIGLPAVLCWPLALILEIVAIITGHMARGQIRKNPALSGGGIALGGLICGYLGIVVIIAVVIGSVYLTMNNKALLQTIQSQINAAAAQATNNAPANQ